MKTKDLDVVYFVKESNNNPEFLYSLRSICMNMPFRRVWVFGGCPLPITPDVRVRVDQNGITKWDRVRNMFRMACENKEITDDFILFNDDFFVMKPTERIDSLYRSSLSEHIDTIETAYWHKVTPYTKKLRETEQWLKDNGHPTLSYGLHTPFIFNKEKLLNLINTYPDLRCSRTVYGNFYNIGGTQHEDIKIFSDSPNFDWSNSRFLSTDDCIVNPNNDIWREMKKRLYKKSVYER